MQGIGKRIRLQRERLKMSRKKLEVKTGVSYATLTKIELEKNNNPTIDVIRAIAEGLEISLSWLLGEEIDPDNEHVSVERNLHFAAMRQRWPYTDVYILATLPDFRDKKKMPDDWIKYHQILLDQKGPAQLSFDFSTKE